MDGWLTLLTASQNPMDCGRARFLAVENDLPNAGMGMLSKLLLAALMLAVRQQRVLVEVPTEGARNGSARALWCERPPYTLECVFEPWSYCALPAGRLANATLPWRGRRWPYGQWPDAAPTVRISVEWLHRSQALWQGTQQHVASQQTKSVALAHILFRPRRWVRQLGDCVMRTSGLLTSSSTAAAATTTTTTTSSSSSNTSSTTTSFSNTTSTSTTTATTTTTSGASVRRSVRPFVAVFVRDSPEKRAELTGRGGGAATLSGVPLPRPRPRAPVPRLGHLSPDVPPGCGRELSRLRRARAGAPGVH